jgi:hypothetical protein
MVAINHQSTISAGKDTCTQNVCEEHARKPAQPTENTEKSWNENLSVPVFRTILSDMMNHG